jgi:hypothetical protein
VRTAALLAILASFHGACETVHVDAPPVAVVTAEGEVRASSMADAQRVSSFLADLAPRVRKRLVEARSKPPQVYVLDYDIPGFTDGCNADGRIIMTAKARPHERFVLAHELVHWQLSGTWRTLPHTMQEGLADRIAVELAPETRIERELMLSYALRWSRVRDP